MVINEKGQKPEKDFLSIWRKCLVKSKNAYRLTAVSRGEHKEDQKKKQK
jgi:hypothetical protein